MITIQHRSPGRITFVPSSTCLQVTKTNKAYLVLFPSLLGLGEVKVA
jgi:hypothetical protein